MRLAHQRQFIDRLQIQKTLKKKPTISPGSKEIIEASHKGTLNL